VTLSARLAEDLCGDSRLVDDAGQRRRRHVVAIEQLEAAGILALHTDYSTGRHGRRWTVWYQFGTGVLSPVEVEGRVLGRRLVEEGELVVIAAQGRGGPRVVVRARSHVPIASNVWWRRMYERRAFTPAEFFEADERHVLPGPYRDRQTARGEG
jgi:hypothetical protein